MGFDLNGIDPKNKKGRYFRNNVWWWKRMAMFVLHHVDLPDRETESWFFNGGQKVSEKSALKIAKFLRKALEEKESYKDWIETTEKLLLEAQQKMILEMRGKEGKKDPDYNKCFYPFRWDNVERFAEFCENSGGFKIW